MILPSSMHAQVADLLRRVAAEQVLPRFRALRRGDVGEKSPGETVTIADLEAEAALTAGLLDLLPSARVVGEEACAADPRLLEGLDEGLVWLVDPLDGTSNFARGDGGFAMLVALLQAGEAVAAWLYEPLRGALASAETGSGAFLDGARLQIAAGPALATHDLHGVVKTRFLPPAQRAALAPGRPGLPTIHQTTTPAGLDYPALALGQWRFLLYWRTLAWDHVPGCLFITEAGGTAARLDGTPYRAAAQGTGLLVASDAQVWRAVRGLLPDAAGGG